MFRLRPYLLLAFALVVSSFALAQSDNPDLDAAMRGDPVAQLRLAKAYQFGDGQRKDLVEAVRWYKAAAAKGNAEAAYTLGTFAYNGDVLGDNVRQSDIGAWAWFRAAADEGYADAVEAANRSESELSALKLIQAHELLATFYMTGKSVPANPTLAAREFDWLSQHSSRQGTLLLGIFYREGRGVPKDLVKARELCAKAARENTPGANYCLSLISDEEGDANSAFESLKKDADHGYPQAMLAIIDRYHDGVGTKADPVHALAWAIRSVDGGINEAEPKRQSIAAELPEKQRKNAAKMALKLAPVVPLPKVEIRQKK